MTPRSAVGGVRSPAPWERATLAIVAAALVVTFADLLSTTRLPAYRDLLGFTLPLKHYLAERARAGSMPLWNPWILLGTPFLANLQSAVFYPPSALLLLPFPLGLNLFLLAHYLIACSGSWAWLRGRGLSIPAAAVGSSVFALGGYLLSVMNLTNHLQGSVWAPWVLLFWAHHVRDRSVKTMAMVLAVLCLQLVGGSPESLLITLAVMAGWTIYDSFPRWREIARLSIELVVALALVAGLCAVQILPTIEYLGQSVRAGPLSWGETSSWSLQPVSLLQLLFPHSSALLPTGETHSLGPEFENNLSLLQSLYLGVGALCLAICGLARGRERRFWGAIIAVAAILALGKHTPLLHWLYEAVPAVFGRFRYPEKFYLAVHLGAAVAAAEGAQCIIERRNEAERTVWIAIVAFATVAGLIYVLRWFAPIDYLRLIAILSGKFLPLSQFVSLGLDTYWKAQRLILVVAALALILVLRRGVLGQASATLLLVALVATDLASANRNLNVSLAWDGLAQSPLLVDLDEVRETQRRIFHYQVVATADGAERRLTRWVHTISSSDDLSRTYSELQRALYANRGMVYGIGTVSGGDGIARASDAALLEVLLGLPVDRGTALLAVYGAGYLIGPDPLEVPEVEPIASPLPSPYHAYRIRDPLPLVYAVSRLEVAPDLAAAFRKVIAPSFPAGEEAIVESLPPGWTNPAGKAQLLARVQVLEHAPELWRIAVDSPARTFLVLNESFFPGWTAKIDSAPSPIYRVNGIVRGLPVDPGRHQIEFRYRPASLRRGAEISIATLAVTGLLLWARSRRPQERPR